MDNNNQISTQGYNTIPDITTETAIPLPSVNIPLGSTDSEYNNADARLFDLTYYFRVDNKSLSKYITELTMSKADQLTKFSDFARIKTLIENGTILAKSTKFESVQTGDQTQTITDRSGVTPGSYGSTVDVTVNAVDNKQVVIPYFTVNEQGIITSATNQSYTFINNCSNCGQCSVTSTCNNCSQCNVTSTCNNCNQCNVCTNCSIYNCLYNCTDCGNCGHCCDCDTP